MINLAWTMFKRRQFVVLPYATARHPRLVGAGKSNLFDMNPCLRKTFTHKFTNIFLALHTLSEQTHLLSFIFLACQPQTCSAPPERPETCFVSRVLISLSFFLSFSLPHYINMHNNNKWCVIKMVRGNLTTRMSLLDILATQRDTCKPVCARVCPNPFGGPGWLHVEPRHIYQMIHRFIGCYNTQPDVIEAQHNHA